MRKILFTLLMLPLVLGAYAQGTSAEKVVTFRFVPGDDMFYIPWEGNDVQLDALYGFIDQYKTEITTGRMPVYVDGYSSSMRSADRNRELAFIRANRVKSELILHKGLVEDNFITKNYTTAYTAPNGTIYKDMVVVTLRIPAKAEETDSALLEQRRREREAAERARQEQAERERVERERIERERAQAEADRTAREQAERDAPAEQTIIAEPAPCYSRWSVGANVGMPFFWGDMISTSGDKTYIGVMVGVQGTYQISPLLGVTLSLDWAQNKAGSRDYAKGYLLDAGGMTWYTPQSFATEAYGDLYSKINMYSAGLHLDVNVNLLFGPRIANSRLKLIASPAIYAQHFSSKIYTKSDNKVYVGERLSKDVSLGLGGDVALRYNVSPVIDLQLKGTGVWITDNCFDNIRTVGHVKQNAMWGVSAGVVWKIGGNRAANLLHKTK